MNLENAWRLDRVQAALDRVQSADTVRVKESDLRWVLARARERVYDQPPPADADALRERVLADWADCPHCHHWGHQHKGGVCCVCDKRDETCGLFAALAAPQLPAGEG